MQMLTMLLVQSSDIITVYWPQLLGLIGISAQWGYVMASVKSLKDGMAELKRDIRQIREDK